MNSILKLIRIAIISVVILSSCTKVWNDHYGSHNEVINQSVWENIKSFDQYSEFVEIMEEYGLDSIFEDQGSYTLFIPNNEAFNTFNKDSGDIDILLRFHILDYIFNTVNIDESRLIRTSTGKFTQLEAYQGTTKYSGKVIVYSSPLFENGKFYEIEEIAYPLPNLYEYIAKNTTVLQEYILRFDSIIMDYEKSRPLEFNESGKIVYDSVYQLVNYFDSIYFPINEESRNKAATFLLFSDEQYETALTDFAQRLGGELNSSSDIPEKWQTNVLIPELIKTGLFPKMLQYDDFLDGKLKNINGDTVQVDFMNIDRESKVFCSNGLVYRYTNFEVPEYLYANEIRIEGEHMVDSIGAGIFSWKPDFKVYGTPNAVSVRPKKVRASGAQNDSLITLQFPNQPFTGEYNIEFYFRDMFPQKYLFVWGANYRPSGLYEIYVNDVLVREFDTFQLRQTVFSVNGSDYYFPVNGNNRFDAMVDYLDEFGDIKITLKYIGPGGTSSITPLNGLSIDFVSLIPVD